MSERFNTVSVAVVGSVNLDIVARVPAFPEPGETLTGARVARFPGGKGGNQALAACRLGAEVFMVACVGDDSAADEALANLRSEGVHLDHVRRLPGESTGLALILVSDAGENQIVVAPGANAAFKPEWLDLPRSDAVIAQLEVPMETILAVAKSHSGFFCLNAAPARPVADEVLARTDLLVVNEIEARAIGDQLDRYEGLLALTLGSRGAVLSRRGEVIGEAVPPAIEAVDTTGAGDAFTATLTVALVSGMPEIQALELACRAGAWCALRPGAQSAPTAAELFAPTPPRSTP
ncbi:MAG: ribokinase [Xanthomonadales bacterium]|nr:ribokinase [Xanthomonadales bacterium]